MSGLDVATLSQEALLLALLLSLPPLLAAGLTGLLVSVLQSITQIQDPLLAHLPKLAAVVATLAVAGPWMGRHIVLFAARVFAL